MGSGEDIWVGYEDQTVEGNWLGLDGEVAQNLPWGYLEPNVEKGFFDCAAVEPKWWSINYGLLAATHCRYNKEHLCMRREYHSPLKTEQTQISRTTTVIALKF